MTRTPKLIWEQINANENDVKWDMAKVWGVLPQELKVTKGDVIFPRIDIKKELEELEAAMKITQEQSIANKTKKEQENKEESVEEMSEITIDDFIKVKMHVGKVLECTKVEKSSKLLKFQIKIGNEVRQIFSGIAKHYAPEDLIGKNVVVVTNLKPRKMMGDMSYGMILSALDDEGKLSLLTTMDENFIDGSEVG